jgi:ribosomal protein L37AE/L43A
MRSEEEIRSLTNRKKAKMTETQRCPICFCDELDEISEDTFECQQCFKVFDTKELLED